MTKINYTKYILILLLIILFQSCEKVIDLNINESDKKIVLNSIVKEGENIKVNLSKSKSVLDDSDIEYLENANIILTENNIVISSHTYNGMGNYIFNKNAISGKKYKIQVNANNLTEINAETIVYKPNEFEITDTSTINHDGENTLGIVINIKNTESNSYFFMEAINKYGDPIYLNSYDIKAEQDLWGEYLLFSNIVSGEGNIDFQFFLSKYFFAYEKNKSYGNITFVLHRVSDSYYKYYISSIKQSNVSGNPFAEPVQVFNNIENGLGVFGSESLSMDTLIIN
jgi:hypothetical protein